MWGKLLEQIVRSPLWDCSTHWFTQRARGGDRLARLDHRTHLPRICQQSDTHRSQGWEEAELDQAAALTSICKEQTMPSRAMAPADMPEILVGVLGELPFWAATPVGEHNSWGWGQVRSGKIIGPVGTHDSKDKVWVMPSWDRLQ